jgi:hypothetical protein
LPFSLPCGHGLQAAQLSFRLPCTQRLRPAIASRGRHGRARARKCRRFQPKRCRGDVKSPPRKSRASYKASYCSYNI